MHGKLSRRTIKWKKRAGKTTLEAAFTDGGQRGIAFYNAYGALRARVYYDGEMQWMRTEYFSPDDDRRARITFKPDDHRDAVIRFDYNDSTGKTIADRTEESLDKVFTAAAAGKSFSTIKNEFSADTAVQKTAKEQYQQLCDAYLNSDTNTGITSITVSSVSTTVTNESNQMKIETNVTAAIERRTRFLHFFRKTKIETVTWKLESVVTLENEKWVMGSDFLKGVELSK